MLTASPLFERNVLLSRRGVRCWLSSARSITHRMRKRTTYSCIAMGLTSLSRNDPILSFNHMYPTSCLLLIPLLILIIEFVVAIESDLPRENGRFIQKERVSLRKVSKIADSCLSLEIMPTFQSTSSESVESCYCEGQGSIITCSSCGRGVRIVAFSIRVANPIVL